MARYALGLGLKAGAHVTLMAHANPGEGSPRASLSLALDWYYGALGGKPGSVKSAFLLSIPC